MNIDPVCGMEVDEKESSVSQFYKGRAFFFCSETCFQNFSANPEKYASEAKGREEGEKGGFFSRWIKKLGESASKSPPPKCH